MAKIGPKEAATRALAGRKSSRPARKAPKSPRPAASGPKPSRAKGSKPVTHSVASNKRPLRRKVVLSFPGDPDVVLKAGPTPKIGRPSTGFDRKAYQRTYCRWRARYPGLKSSQWPPEAQSELALVRTHPLPLSQ